MTDPMTPASRRLRMPAEGDPHDRTWMVWPTTEGALGSAASARTAWAAVANAAAGFEPVTMVVNPGDENPARQALDSAIDIVVAPVDDAWMRDIGSTFVLDEAVPDRGVSGGGMSDGGADAAAPSMLAAVDWNFNGWGAQAWSSWGRDRLIAGRMAEWTGARPVATSIVQEGGGIHVDGLGTVLLTETVQLDPGRNPSRTRAEIEAELARTIGATAFVWLPRGLTRDYEPLGTRGHVDIVATIPSPGVVLLHRQLDPAHPDFALWQVLRDVLTAATDASGACFEVLELAAPTVLRDSEGFVDYSYVNHTLVNGGVIACSFSDPNDDRARGILADAYPGREVVSVDARAIFALGGGIHCITQQQPSLPTRQQPSPPTR